ncbi:HlyD family efflux transporter periplasmic adaptor subunit [Trinickia fusca]|uniref:HlyD family efflux transporter periplasmic adaptor subunit n=1 Tax=Trinickia fusca TaxID=2419777 RepID=A0A494X5H0_9BURK|nr:HlyD family efflux transporter periplasmic adaptor subunit [Trinickia fusca]RKP43414.1 HlyD family efflux transporter periplasmic adaptor subunit [Trinickia fusca]
MKNNAATTKDKAPLIRQEALVHASLRRHGTVLLTTSRVASITSAAALTTSLCLVALLMCASYTRKVSIHGHLRPAQGALAVVFGVEGVVTKVRVKDGEKVSTGTPMFEIQTAASSGSPIVIVARHAGIVTDLAVDIGQLVKPSLPLALVFPEGTPLEGDAYVSAQLLGQIREGTNVSIRYSALPFQTFGQFHGVITEITETTNVPAAVRSGTTLDQPAESIFRVRIRLDPQSTKSLRDTSQLRSGMLFDASVPLERHRLYQWILPSLSKPSGRI